MLYVYLECQFSLTRQSVHGVRLDTDQHNSQIYTVCSTSHKTFHIRNIKFVEIRNISGLGPRVPADLHSLWLNPYLSPCNLDYSQPDQTVQLLAKTHLSMSV